METILTRRELSEAMLIRPRALTLGEGLCKFPELEPVVISANHFEQFGYLLRQCGLNGPQTGQSSKEECIIRAGTCGAPPSVTESGDEAYSLLLAPDGVAIRARTDKGLAQGMKTLARLRRELSSLPCCTIQDAPQTSFRALHLCIFPPQDGTRKEDTSPAAVRRMLTAAAMAGYNAVFLEFWGMFPYRKHPYACWPDSAFTRETVEELIRFSIEDLHITPLPCQNMASHAGWSRIDSRKHVVLDQRPDLAPLWIPGGWCFATENPETRRFLADIMEDLLETFRSPPLFHVSCDKCFGFGSAEADRTTPADRIFARHLRFLHELLQSHGTRMAMWGDMLYSSLDSLYWKAAPALAETLPRDILINLWTHNDPGESWADIDFFQERGFQTVYSPFQNREGIRHMTELCRSKDSLGIVQTTWHLPQSTAPAVVYSGALQWCGEEPDSGVEEAFLRRWCAPGN